MLIDKETIKYISKYDIFNQYEILKKENEELKEKNEALEKEIVDLNWRMPLPNFPNEGH